MIPACRIAPPICCLQRQASVMKSREPAMAAPTGAPRPLVKSIHVVSKGSAHCRAAMPEATTAFMSRAPSMWVLRRWRRAMSVTARICGSGQIEPPPRFEVCSTHTSRLRGMWRFSGRIAASSVAASYWPRGPSSPCTLTPASAAGPPVSKWMGCAERWAIISSPGRQCTRSAIFLLLLVSHWGVAHEAPHLLRGLGERIAEEIDLDGHDALLLHRREGRWHHDLARLRQEHLGAAGRRPQAVGHHLLARGHSRIQARVGPDVHEAVRGAELHVADERDGRDGDAALELGLPTLLDLGKRARAHLVLAKLVEGPVGAGLGFGREGEGDHDLRAHARDELLDLGWPMGVLGRGGPDARPVLGALVTPDVDDLVEWADLRVEEAGELGVLLPVLVRLRVALLDLGQAAHGEPIRADLVDHGEASLGEESDLSEVAPRARMDEFSAWSGGHGVGRGCFVSLGQTGGEDRLTPMQGAGEPVHGLLWQIGPNEDEAPRAHRYDRLALARIRSRGNRHGLEEGMLGLDASAFLGARSDEVCALRPARHRGEARPAHASAPQRGRAPVLHHGGAVARAIEIARLEVALDVEAEAVQDVASEDH